MPDSAQEAVDSGDLDLRGQKLSIMEDTRPKKRRKRSRQSEICILGRLPMDKTVNASRRIKIPENEILIKNEITFQK